MFKEQIKSIIKSAGIRNVGFCAFSDVADKLLPCRAQQRLPQSAKTVIVCIFPYRVKKQQPQKISRYAAVPDYHKVCMNYLTNAAALLKAAFPKNSFEPFIDNSPIPEVYAAACAGLGVQGENGLLLTKEYGSWVFIGELVTDLEITCKNSLKNCCLCGNCKTACPRGVHGVDCLSAVSQRKKELKETEVSALRKYDILWGCDICADVCPYNKNVKDTYIKEFISGYRDGYQLKEDIKNRAYEWRGEKVIKRNFNLLQEKNEELQ